MKLSVLQSALCVSGLIHALAFSALSLAGRGRGGAGPGPGPAHENILELTPLPEPAAAAEPEAAPIAAGLQASVKECQEDRSANALVCETISVSPSRTPSVPLPDSAHLSLGERGPEVQRLSGAERSEQADTPPPAFEFTSGGGEETETVATGLCAAHSGSGCALAAGESDGSPAGYLLNPKPAYPKEARKRKQQGLVLLGVFVAVDGSPVRVAIKESSGFALLDEAALRAVKRWRFNPARKGDSAVGCQVEVPIEFRLAN